MSLGLTYDANSRIQGTNGTVGTIENGLPFNTAGALVFADGVAAPAGFSNGLPFTGAGKLAIHIGGTISSFCNGVPLTSTGRVVVDSTNPVTSWVGGFPQTEFGLSIA